MITGAVAVLAGCGSSGPTNAEYASSVNAICGQLTTDLQGSGPLPRSFRDPASRPTPQDLASDAAFLDGSVSILRGAAAKLHAVSIPDDEADLARTWLSTIDDFIADLSGAAGAARRVDAQGFTAAAFVSAPQAATERDSIGAKLGINGCG